MSKKYLMAGAIFAVLSFGGPSGLFPPRAPDAANPENPGDPAGKEQIMKALKDLANPDPETRQRAVEHLGQAGDMSVVKPLASALSDPQPEIRIQAEKSMWLIWLRSGDAETDKILHLGMELLAGGKFQDAINAFTRVIERAPSFAEGYNKRATALYLDGRFKASLLDCDVTLRLNPYHFGALFGKGLNYLRLNDLPKALEAYRRTLKVVPYSKTALFYTRAIEEKLESEKKEL